MKVNDYYERNYADFFLAASREHWFTEWKLLIDALPYPAEALFPALGVSSVRVLKKNSAWW